MTNNQISKTLMKLGIKIQPTLKQQELIDHFIHSRKRDIISELELDRYTKQEPRSTKDLFF
jgi:hypothetical protein